MFKMKAALRPLFLSWSIMAFLAFVAQISQAAARLLLPNPFLNGKAINQGYNES